MQEPLTFLGSLPVLLCLGCPGDFIDSFQLVHLIKEKLCDLAVRGTIV